MAGLVARVGFQRYRSREGSTSFSPLILRGNRTGCIVYVGRDGALQPLSRTSPLGSGKEHWPARLARAVSWSLRLSVGPYLYLLVKGPYMAIIVRVKHAQTSRLSLHTSVSNGQFTLRVDQYSRPSPAIHTGAEGEPCLGVGR